MSGDKDSDGDSNVIPTTLNETEESKTQCFASSQPNNTSFTFLYEKPCNAIILADRKTQEALFCYCNFGKVLIQRRSELASEKQVDPDSNAVSRILNKEVRAQLPANISDALLWKIIEKAKKLYKLFSVIDNVTFDYSIKIEPTLKSEFPEPSSGSDQQISCEKENKDSEFLETEVGTTFIPSVPLFHTSNSEDIMSEDNKYLPEEEDNNISEKAESLLEGEEAIWNFRSDIRAIARAILTRSHLDIDKFVPRTKKKPDQFAQSGLIRFERKNEAPRGYFTAP
ncbi:12829_t:CDS:2, partial [Acaulospora morrowiae]